MIDAWLTMPAAIRFTTAILALLLVVIALVVLAGCHHKRQVRENDVYYCIDCGAFSLWANGHWMSIAEESVRLYPSNGETTRRYAQQQWGHIEVLRDKVASGELQLQGR